MPTVLSEILGGAVIYPAKEDVLSGFFVFLIALPLCMGIALASGFPAVSGIISAIIGGCLASFLGSSRLTIKGPAAGLIVIAVAAVHELGHGDLALGYKRCLAVGVIAAIIQIIFSIGKMGRIAEIMPPSIVHGMLAAIGIIIIAKQIHILFGVTPHASEPLELLLEIPPSLANSNPEVLIIGLLALLILVIFPLLRFKICKVVPAPIIAILLTVPLALYMGFMAEHTYTFLGHEHNIGPQFLVELPNNLLAALTFPDFSVIMTLASMKYIMMFALVGTVESLLTVSAVDSLDPQKQQSNLDKDLFSVGVGNLVSGLIGGLPMISEIVRSKANIDNGAKTHWSNFFHAAFLLIFAAFLPSLLHYIPLAVLSAMLVYTGYRLAQPGEFMHAYKTGIDQFFLFIATFVTTLLTDLLLGVATGLVLKVLLHIYRSKPRNRAFSQELTIDKQENKTVIHVTGACLFFKYLKVKKVIEIAMRDEKPVQLNLSKVILLDLTSQTKFKSLERKFGSARFSIVGLEGHSASSDYPESTKILSI